MIEVIVGVVSILAVGALLFWLGMKFARSSQLPDAPEPQTVEGAKVKLEIEATDPNDPFVQRLIQDAAAHVFASRPDIDYVDVRNRSDRHLARIERHAPTAGVPDMPSAIGEPPGHETRAPDLGDHLREDRAPAGAQAHFDTSPRPGPHRTLADNFDLPDVVRSRVSDPDDAVGIVRAILEAGGLPVDVQGDLLRADDQAVIVIGKGLGKVVTPEELNHAFHRFTQSGARRGVVVTPGVLYPDDLRRRHAMAPALLHAGPEGIQRMADAVALGGNPIRFATGPAFVED